MNIRPQNQHYVQDYELVSLLFPFPEQTLSIYLNGCKTEKPLILFHLDLSLSCYWKIPLLALLFYIIKSQL